MCGCGRGRVVGDLAADLAARARFLTRWTDPPSPFVQRLEGDTADLLRDADVENRTAFPTSELRDIAERAYVRRAVNWRYHNVHVLRSWQAALIDAARSRFTVREPE